MGKKVKHSLRSILIHQNINIIITIIKKLNKCFVLVEEEEPTTMYLYDVNESKNYGTFRQIKDIIYCKVSEDNCESEDAWYKLVKHYMEE